MSSILGIDIGTTAIKFNLFSKEDYLILCSKKYLVPMKESSHEFSTQDPQVILEQVTKGIQAVANEYPIDEIVFSTAMHSLIPIINGEVGEMYLWSDKRAQATIGEFKVLHPSRAKHFYEVTGTPIHAMSPFAKLLYFKGCEPEFFEAVDQWIDLKSFLLHFFTGEYVVDYSIASATGLFNTLTFEWDQEILAFLEVRKSQLPRAVDTNTAFSISQEILKKLDIPTKIQLYAGASDGTLASYASLVGTSRKISLTVGTSGAVRTISSERKISKTQRTFCYYLSHNQWVIGGASNNGGRTLEWANELFYEQKAKIFDEIPNCLTKSPIGAKGLVFLPYINGERAPLWDESVHGVFNGVTLGHNRQDFIRAICEGILFNLKVIYNDFALQEKVNIALSGGFFSIAGMAEEVAAIFGAECVQSDYTEPSFGAVALVAESLANSNQADLAVVPIDPLKEISYHQSFTHFSQILQKERN